MAFRATRAVMAYTKKTTGIVGLPVEPNARAILIDLYATFLEKVKVRPGPGDQKAAVPEAGRGRPVWGARFRRRQRGFVLTVGLRAVVVRAGRRARAVPPRAIKLPQRPPSGFRRSSRRRLASAAS